MQILLLRHAIAEEREAFAAHGLSDEERPLCERGRRRMRDAARGLSRLLPVLDAIGSSPLVRALQTADLLAERFPDVQRETLSALAPGGDRAALLPWLAGLDVRVCALVGHEPDMSELAGWLLSGRAVSFVEFKKGAAALFAFDAAPKPGTARLLWHLPPMPLRLLAAVGQ